MKKFLRASLPALFAVAGARMIRLVSGEGFEPKLEIE
jgi:hypothetical protein